MWVSSTDVNERENMILFFWSPRRHETRDDKSQSFIWGCRREYCRRVLGVNGGLAFGLLYHQATSYLRMLIITFVDVDPTHRDRGAPRSSNTVVDCVVFPDLHLPDETHFVHPSLGYELGWQVFARTLINDMLIPFGMKLKGFRLVRGRASIESSEDSAIDELCSKCFEDGFSVAVAGTSRVDSRQFFHANTCPWR